VHHRLLIGLAMSWPLAIQADPIAIEEITVVGRTGSLIGQVASASEGSVNQQDLEIRPRLRMGELLEAVPGLVATQHSGSGKANQYFLRGFNLDHGTDFATQLDGMPINMRSHGHGQGYTDLNFIIPELVEGIHYRKGPYRVDVGDFTGAGSAVMTSMTETEGQISQGLGEDGFARTLLLGDVFLAGGHFLYGAEYQKYDGPWDQVDESVDKKNLWLKQHWHTGQSQLGLAFMAYDNQWNSADQIPDRAIQQGLIDELGSIDPTVGGESSRYSLSSNWEYTNADGAGWEANLYVVDYDLSLWSNFTYFTDPDGDQFQQVDQRRIYGGELARTQSVMIGGREMRHTLGLQTRVDAIDQVRLDRTRERQTLGTIRADKVQEASYSAYWETRLSLSRSLSTVAGIRYDYFSFDVEPLAAARPGTLSENDGQISDAITTGSLSLIYTLSERQEVYASLGQGFHSNDARGVTLERDPRTGDALSAADPLIDTLGYELGWRGDFGKRFNVSAALWRLGIDSELLFVGDEGTTEDTGVASDRWGLELTGYYTIDRHWTLDLEYAYSNSQFEQPIGGFRDIPGALDKVLTLGLHWQPRERWFANLRLRHLSDYALNGGARAESSTLLNGRAVYQLSERWGVTLDALNLFDSRDRDIEYYYASQLAHENSVVDDHHYHIFTPRTLRVTLTYAF